MISENTPNERPNHTSDETASRAWESPELRRVYLKILHVVPIKLAYLPRLKDVRRVTDAINKSEDHTYSWRETMSEIMIRTSWVMPPPPIPWTARHMMSPVKLFAAPQRAEPNY
jgi:hypothetical protein